MIDIHKEFSVEKGEEGDLLYEPEYYGLNPVTEEKINTQDRWHTYFYRVFQHKKTGKYYRFEWVNGSTEYQECDLDLEAFEVEPVVVNRTIYKVKK